MTASPLGLNSMMKDLSLAGIETILVPPTDVKVIQPNQPAPRDIKVILEDLKILPKLQDFRMAIGDVPLLHPPPFSYTTIQEILCDLQSIQPGKFKKAAFVKMLKSYHRSYSPDWAESVSKMAASHLPAIYKGCQQNLAELTAQLSPNARQCLKTGMKFQDMEKTWNSAIEDANNYFASVPASSE
jgi:hypothetical protein